jgi:hypothetical protein
MHFYEGEEKIKFYFFSDKDPVPFLPKKISKHVVFFYDRHTDWRDGTNSKFSNILRLDFCDSDYLYYFDADTNIQEPFTEDWFIGELVGGEHYSNRTTLSNGQGFDRNPAGNSYVPMDSELPYTYHYGAFFGGDLNHMIGMCKTIRNWQATDQLVNYEPPVNDESYINKLFHYEANITIPIEKFKFIVSDKGGLGNTRDMKLSIDELLIKIKESKAQLWDLQNGVLTINK